MVYVVERYLPGLLRSDLLRGLSRLEQLEDRVRREPAVRYLGSTIVLGDEACFCQFEGPSEAAVAEANRRAGLPFDRIVAAVTVKPRGEVSMSISASIPATVQIKRGRLLGLVAGVAVLAAAATWVVLTFAVDAGNSTSQAVAPRVVAAPVTPAQRSIGSYLFGVSSRLTPGQLQTIRDYQAGAVIPLTSNERSIGSYLFGASTGLTPAQLQTIRNYRVGAATPLSPAEKSIGSYLFGASTGLTPAQLQTVRDYEAGAR